MSNRVTADPNQSMLDGSADFDGVNTVLGLVPSTGVYTMNANIICDALTIRSGARLVTNQYTVWARRIFIEAGGFLSYNGNNASGKTAGAALAAAGHLYFATGAGAAGVTRSTAGSSIGTAAAAVTAGACGAGGAGGTTGGAGGTVTALAADQIRMLKTVWTANRNWRLSPAGTATAFALYNGGSGGGSGAVTLTTGLFSSDSGGGGGGGGIVAFRCGLLSNFGTIEANGGAGGNGVLAGGVTDGGVGGGGGGAGGIVHGVCDVVESLGTIRANGGTGGTGYSVTTAYAGKNGANGTNGLVLVFLGGELL